MKPTIQMHNTNHHLVISGSNDRSARLWDTRMSPNEVAIIARHEEAIRRLQIDDVKMISGGDDSVLRSWDMRFLAPAEPDLRNFARHTNAELRPLCCFRMAAHLSGRVSALQFDATRLITAFTLGTTANGAHVRRGSIKIWDLSLMTADEDAGPMVEGKGGDARQHKAYSRK